MKRKTLRTIGLICGLVAVLMLFSGGFIIEIFFKEYANNWTVCGCVFIVFLCLLFTANVIGEKTSSTKIDEVRNEKLENIL